MNEYIKLAIWAVAIVAIFLFAWRKGYLLRLSAYWAETIEELKKCSWPSIEELKGSTVVIMVTIALLGVFTVVVDLGIEFVISRLLI